MVTAGGGSSSMSRGWARRYPALAFVAVSVVLALLLPSGLTLPNSGPSTLAEYAPVPGQSQGQADLAELVGAASRGGLGFGPGGGSGAGATAGSPDDVEAPGRLVRKPGTKRCVGAPPRQSEDPLSPPCVSFFEGDNFGATAKGVTKDEVIVGLTASFDLSSDPKPGEMVDCGQGPAEDDHQLDLYCKAFMAFFNDRYQTYNRRVRLFMGHNVSFKDQDARRKLFAYVGDSGASDAAKGGTVGVRYASSSRTSYAALAPYLISFRPDIEDHRRMTASYICQKLAGRLARFAGEPTLQASRRKFAVWYEDDGRGQRDALAKELDSQCGLRFDDEQQGANAGSNPTVGVTAASRMRSNGITSVVVMASAVGFLTTSATQAGWFPEWIVPANSGLRHVDTNSYARNATQDQWRNAFGVTLDYRRDSLREQHWYRAYKEGCPDCPEPDSVRGSLGPAIYDQLALLFHGIQVSGPRLTAANMDKGLHAIPPRASDDPYRPAAYFAPGNWSYLKDSMAIWWDPTGQPPGSGSAGCYRLPHNGRRFRALEWNAGDDDVRGTGPCQADTLG